MAIAGELPLSLEDEGPVRDGSQRHGDSVNTLVDLYSNHQQRIYRYCLALLRNPDDAEDATQETFTRAAPFLPRLPGDLSAYLTTVARNICCDVVRARSRKSVPIENVPLTDRRVSPERQSVDWDVVRRMWRQLTPSERLLFAYTFAGYKYEEIASRTGMSRPSVSVGLARARRRLRDLAAATGTLALLPVALKRLLHRAARRAGRAVDTSQAVVVQMVDQAGTMVAGLLAGAFAVSAAAGATASLAGAPARATPATGATATVAAAATVLDGSAAAGQGLVAAEPSRHQTQTPPPAATPPAVLAPALSGLPGSGATPDATGINHMAASPDYPKDHTVYASGPVLGDNCVASYAGTCSALFRTSDAGTSWTRLAVLDYSDGPILLPPSYPADPAFFMLIPNVRLAESSRGDGNFDWTVDGVTAAAIAPWSSPGHPHVAAVLGSTVVFYDPESSTTPPQPLPGPAVPPNFTVSDVAFAGPDAIVLRGIVLSPGDTTGRVAATVCPTSGVCQAPTVFPDVVEGVLRVSPNVAADHLVLVTSTTHAYLSKDGGQSFQTVFSAPSGTDLETATIGSGPAGPRVVLSYMASAATTGGRAPRPIVLTSDDIGATFTNVTGNLDAVDGLVSLAAYPDGTMLAGISGSVTTDTFTLRQSNGSGTWIKPS